MNHVGSTPQVCGVVLAAGAGTRMGTPKALLAGPAGPLVQLAATALGDGGCDPLAVVLGAEGAAVAELLPDAATPLDNPDWEGGMSTSVQVALHWAGEQTALGLMILPVDTPGIGPAVVARLVAAFRQAPDPESRVIQATYDGKPRNPVLIGAAFYDDVADSVVGDEGARVWLSSRRAAIQDVECADIGDPHDLDSPDQLDRWRRMDARPHPGDDMELTHNFTVPVAPEVAFEVLQDIERIGPCMPGATIDSVDGESFTGTVKVKIGPIKVTYRGEAEYADVDAESMSATINARGKESRGSGTANAVVTANVKPSGDGAEVNVVTDLAVTGKPAQFGRGVMEEVGQKLINTFAECLATKLGEDGVDAEGGDDVTSADAPTGDEPAGEATGDEATGDEATGDGATGDDAGAADSTAAATSNGSAAVSLSSGGQSSAATQGSDSTTTGGKPTAASKPQPAPRHEAEAIDLLDVAGAPVAKRVAPIFGGILLIAIIWWWKRR